MKRQPIFAKLPLALLRNRRVAARGDQLSFGAVCLFSRMRLLANKKGTCKVGHSFLAAELSVSARQIRNFLAELDEAKLVSWQRNKRAVSTFRIDLISFERNDGSTQDSDGTNQEWKDSSSLSGNIVPEEFFRVVDEVKQEVFQREDNAPSSSRPTSRTEQPLLAEWIDDDDGPDQENQNPKPEPPNFWPRIEASISKTRLPCRVSFDDRARIEQELQGQGHTIETLAVYLETQGLGGNLRNRSLELLRFVPHFSRALSELASHSDRYEDRLLDRHGLQTEQRMAIFDDLMAENFRGARESAGVKDGEPFCMTCRGTGRTTLRNPRRRTVKLPCTCEAGKQAEAEDDAAVLAQGACPECLGRSSSPICGACRGSGRAATVGATA
jgi:hypothetical protein